MITLVLQCRDADNAAWVMLIHQIYEAWMLSEDAEVDVLLMDRLPQAIMFLREAVDDLNLVECISDEAAERYGDLMERFLALKDRLSLSGDRPLTSDRARREWAKEFTEAWLAFCRHQAVPYRYYNTVMRRLWIAGGSESQPRLLDVANDRPVSLWDLWKDPSLIRGIYGIGEKGFRVIVAALNREFALEEPGPETDVETPEPTEAADLGRSIGKARDQDSPRDDPRADEPPAVVIEIGAKNQPHVNVMTLAEVMDSELAEET